MRDIIDVLKSASGVLTLEMLSGGVNMSISDVHRTTPPNGYYKLNVVQQWEVLVLW
jgi:hypothetical protein